MEIEINFGIYLPTGAQYYIVSSILNDMYKEPETMEKQLDQSRKILNPVKNYI